MGIQRWAAEICRCEFGPHIEHESTEDGSYVLYSDHIEREKVLREALREAKEFIENQQLPETEWSRVLDICVAALRTMEDINGD